MYILRKVHWLKFRPIMQATGEIRKIPIIMETSFINPHANGVSSHHIPTIISYSELTSKGLYSDALLYCNNHVQ